MQRSLYFRLPGLTLVLALLWLIPSGLAAQTGTMTGQTTDARSGQPLGAVQLTLEGTGLGTLSQANGRFTLENIPAGEYTLTAQRLGYSSVTREVTILAGESLNVDLALTQQALALDEFVITGTAGGTQARAVGNVVGRVDAVAVTELAPVQSFQDLLSGRESGVTYQRSSGNIGTGAQVRIRGYSSLGVGNQPLIYIDGIRVDNNAQAGPNLRDGRQTSKLDDINPNDIESIEIIKGPAAATLYGTEASAGVINIVTRRGATGAPQFDLVIRQGATWLMDPSRKVGESFRRDPATGELLSFNIWDEEKAAGRPFFGTGHNQAYNLSLRGGTDLVRYFLSADWDDQTGIVDYNWQSRLGLRANVTVVPRDNLTVDFSTGFTDGTTSYMQQKTSWGVWEQAQWANPLGRDSRLRGFLRARPEEIADIEATRDFSRFTGSATFNHSLDNLTQRLVVGIDVSHDENTILFPRHPDGAAHDFGALSLGDIEVEKPSSQYTTLDYGLSLRYAGLRPELRFTTSAGVQYYHRRQETLFGDGRIFPAPAIRNLGGAAIANSSQSFIENKSLGAYIQQEFNWDDRIFFTAAVRGDDNSAFGADFDAAIYPKFSATWVVTDQDFWRWDHLVNSLRLRSAWGKAGQQPDVFAAVRLYSPAVGPAQQSVVTPQEVGNPDLGPEVSTELELGFDAALFGDRLSAQFTYYTQSITDALVALPVAPSRGFPGSQFSNLGQVSNWGWELGLDGRILERDRYSLDMGMNVSFNENRVDDMGGRPPTTMIREGFPFPSLFIPIVVSAEIDETGQVRNVMCDGGTGRNGWERGGEAVPCSTAAAPRVFAGRGSSPWDLNFNSTLTLFRNIRVYANVEMQTGRVQHIWDVGCRHTCFGTSRAANVRDDPIFLAYAETGVPDTFLGMYDAGFAKLREVSVSYTLPDNLAGRIGASRASVTAAGRNLWTIWVAQDEVFGAPVPDPETRNAADVTVFGNSNMPPLSNFLVTMRVTF